MFRLQTPVPRCALSEGASPGSDLGALPVPGARVGRCDGQDRAELLPDPRGPQTVQYPVPPPVPRPASQPGRRRHATPQTDKENLSPRPPTTPTTGPGMPQHSYPTNHSHVNNG